jgi:uncharacterized protein
MSAPGTGLRTGWALTKGAIGMENQALGIVEALGLAAEVKRLKPPWPWRGFPPQLWLAPDRAIVRPLAPPWPDVLVACGWHAGGMAAAVKRLAGDACFVVYVQAPPLAIERYDLVVAPRHDRLEGPNVFVTEAAVHRVTAAKLAEAARRFGPDYADLPRPRVALLLGGSNGRHRMTVSLAEKLGADLARLAKGAGAGLMVTPSRRTDPAVLAALAERLAGTGARIWDGQGENPYFAMLALADHILATEDSVSMTSEALATGKPVHTVALEGGSRRIDSFHQTLRDRGLTRRFDGTLPSWTYAPPDDTARAAAEIRRRLAARSR